MRGALARSPRARSPLRLGAALLWLPVALVSAACETSDGGYAGGGYYDGGFYDPWYYGGVDWDDDDIALPPDGGARPPRPEHPIARPPPPRPTPRPMPSIPSRARPSRR